MDVQEAKLYSILEYVDAGNYSKASQEVAKATRKYPNNEMFKSLKALIYTRTGRIGEANFIIDEVIKIVPADEAALNLVVLLLRETDQAHKIDAFIRTALEKYPKREDFIVIQFFQQLIAKDFKNLQTAALKLSPLESRSEYKFPFWAIVAKVLQCQDNQKLAKSVLLPLAKKMATRLVETEQITRHTELQVLLDILKRLEHYEEALQLLDNESLIERVNTLDYTYDYTTERLTMAYHLNLWDRAQLEANKLLSINVDDWTAWKLLLRMIFRKSSPESKLTVDEERLRHLCKLLESREVSGRTSRAISLARLDILANLHLAGEPCEAKVPFDAGHIVRDYIHNLGHKALCAIDLADIIAMVFPDDGKREQFTKDLLTEANKQITSISGEADISTCQRILTAFQVARPNAARTVTFADILDAFSRLAQPRFSSSDLPQFTEETEPKDLLPCDGFALLAASFLADQMDSTDRRFLGSILVGFWLQRLCLAFSPMNHHARLLTARLLSPLGGLNCPYSVMEHFQKSSVKQTLILSLGHMLVMPGPQVAIWSTAQAAAARPGKASSYTSRVMALEQDQDQPPVPAPPPTQSRVQPGKRDLQLQMRCPYTPGMSLVDYLARLRTMSDILVRETEDCLFSAFKRGTYTQVEQFVLFIDQIKRSHVLVLARAELSTWRTLVLPDGFDHVLEELSVTEKEAKYVSSQLDELCDLRDHNFTPLFNGEHPTMVNEVESFNQIKRWTEFRLIIHHLISVVATCTMDLVCRQSQADHKSSNRAVTALSQLPSLRERIACLSKAVTSTPPQRAADIKPDQLTCTPKNLLSSGPVIAPLEVLALYVHGPFFLTMNCLIDVILALNAFVESQDPVNLIVVEKCVKNARETLLEAPLFQAVEQLEPAASSSGHTAPEVITLLGVAFESVCILVHFACSLASFMRPRSVDKKKSLKKRQKNRKKAAQIDTTDETHPLDKVGELLATELVEPLRGGLLTRLSESCDKWLEWLSCDAETGASPASEQILQQVSVLAREVLGSDLVQKYPMLVPAGENPGSAEFVYELCHNWRNGFAQLQNGFRRKAATLNVLLTSDLSPFVPNP